MKLIDICTGIAFYNYVTAILWIELLLFKAIIIISLVYWIENQYLHYFVIMNKRVIGLVIVQCIITFFTLCNIMDIINILKIYETCNLCLFVSITYKCLTTFNYFYFIYNSQPFSVLIIFVYNVSFMCDNEINICMYV